MEALAIWLSAIWLGWKIDEASERIASALADEEEE